MFWTSICIGETQEYHYGIYLGLTLMLNCVIGRTMFSDLFALAFMVNLKFMSDQYQTKPMWLTWTRLFCQLLWSIWPIQILSMTHTILLFSSMRLTLPNTTNSRLVRLKSICSSTSKKLNRYWYLCLQEGYQPRTQHRSKIWQPQSKKNPTRLSSSSRV